MRLIDRRAPRAVVGVILALGLFAACSSSSKPAESNPSTTLPAAASTDTCKALDQFRSSLTHLREQVTSSGLNKDTIQSSIDTAQSDLDKLKSDLKDADRPRVDALQSAIDDFKDAVDNMDGLSGINAVIDAGQKVASASSDLYDAVREGCKTS
jgi:membrane-bound lytic murein transglycosylase B